MSAPATVHGIEPLMTVDEVAAVLRCSAHTVYRLRYAGKLPGVEVGRQVQYRPEDVRAFIAGALVTGAVAGEAAGAAS